MLTIVNIIIIYTPASDVGVGRNTWENGEDIILHILFIHSRKIGTFTGPATGGIVS